jgi:hypothetical protein
MSTRAIDNSRTSERLSMFLSEIHSNEPVDNIFVELPTLDYLMKNRKKSEFGRQIMVPLDTAQNSSVKSFADTEAFSTTVPNTARTAVYPAKNYGGALVWTWEEMREQAGNDHKVFDLVKHRRNSLMNSLKDLLNSDLYAASPGSKDINSIPSIVTVDRSHGGINSTTSTYWDSQETTSVGAFSSNGLSNMRTLYNDIVRTGAGKPGMILTTQTVFEAFEAEIDVDVRYSNAEGAMGRGPESLRFKSTPIHFEADMATGQLYMLNSKWLELWVDSASDFSVGKVQEAINSNVFVAKLVFRGQVLSVQPRALGRLTGIT